MLNGYPDFKKANYGPVRVCPYMTSDGMGEGGSAKSDFITKRPLIKHLMTVEGGRKRAENHLTSYMDDPFAYLNLSPFCIHNLTIWTLVEFCVRSTSHRFLAYFKKPYSKET